jgi:succinate dehydrogenase / fumarate reductase iron-sulfur subunit
MKISMNIQRFNPATDQAPYFQTFTVDAEPDQRLLMVLMDIRENQDSSLAFRKSCAHGVCGSDAMRVNGKECLACKTLIRDILPEDGSPIRIEPLKHLPVQRDLMVDQTPFFKKFEQVRPFFLSRKKMPEKENIQSPADRQVIDEGTQCILCEACYSACPVLDEKNPDFVGPFAIVQSERFNRDSRDEGSREREPILDTNQGVWACENHFECTRVCPRGIKITKQINQTKRRLKKP